MFYKNGDGNSGEFYARIKHEELTRQEKLNKLQSESNEFAQYDECAAVLLEEKTNDLEESSEFSVLLSNVELFATTFDSGFCGLSKDIWEGFCCYIQYIFSKKKHKKNWLALLFRKFRMEQSLLEKLRHEIEELRKILENDELSDKERIQIAKRLGTLQILLLQTIEYVLLGSSEYTLLYNIILKKNHKQNDLFRSQPENKTNSINTVKLLQQTTSRMDSMLSTNMSYKSVHSELKIFNHSLGYKVSIDYKLSVSKDVVIKDVCIKDRVINAQYAEQQPYCRQLTHYDTQDSSSEQQVVSHQGRGEHSNKGMPSSVKQKKKQRDADVMKCSDTQSGINDPNVAAHTTGQKVNMQRSN
ncbi:hypothetical protein BIY23_04655 [Wolbachia pipientis]|uniref:Uncharacterized protein n=1 Tax=Wolbachia pipientis TaxID=955 RepID=A0A1E7QK48_WOLPI|nr:hypothetical protein [Wolbachia pipientis]OEY86841.1 hypothetical protein BIY23_04655 [Wolbachia pipientis]